MAKYIWYSGATDTTGMALAEALNITGTKARPKALVSGDLVVGWGAKIDNAINLPQGVTVWNSPNAIRENRNKFSTLQKMLANEQLRPCVAKFCNAASIKGKLASVDMKFPLVGRTNFHQGGKGFWLCLNSHHVDLAINDGAQYFQEFINIVDEYRLHVMFGEVAYAVRKTANPEDGSWIANQKKKIEEASNKHNWNLDEGTMDKILGVLVKQAQLPDYIVRSNRRGWKFVSVKLANVSQSLKNAAVRAVEVVGLQFGAVDCAIGLDGNPYIIEVNSGPGLEGTAKDKYIEVFKAKILEFDAPKKQPILKKAAEAVGKVVKKTTGVPKAKAVAAGADDAIDDDDALALLKVAETDEDRLNVLKLLRKKK